jgi:hypothetical protein
LFVTRTFFLHINTCAFVLNHYSLYRSQRAQHNLTISFIHLNFIPGQILSLNLFYSIQINSYYSYFEVGCYYNYWISNSPSVKLLIHRHNHV